MRRAVEEYGGDHEEHAAAEGERQVEAEEEIRAHLLSGVGVWVWVWAWVWV